MILVDSGPEKTTHFAKHAREIYEVMQNNSRGVVVRHHKLGLTGYVLPQANVEIEKGLIDRVTAPCLVLTELLQRGTLRMSVCNPDLGWQAGVQYDYRNSHKEGDQPPTAPVSMPVTLTLKGRWKVNSSTDEVTLTASPNSTDTAAPTTEITVATNDARSIEFELEKVE